MKKLYVVTLNNKKGKEIFEGETYRLANINGKSYNLIGDADIDKPEEVALYSSKTNKLIHYADVSDTVNKVNKDTKRSFIVIK